MRRFDRGPWNRDRHHRGHMGLVGGAVLALIGVLLLLQNLGVSYFQNLEKYWPVILIVAGVAKIAGSGRTGGRIWGGMVFLVGVLFLVSNLGLIHGDIWRFVWPSVLIVIGLGMLARSFDRRRYGPPFSGADAKAMGEHIRDQIRDRIVSDAGRHRQHWGPWAGTQSAVDHLNEWAIFGGSRRRVDSQNFQGGEAFAMFGGIELDLRNAATTLSEVVIEVNALFGGVEVKVPENWNISVRGTGILGGYEDKTYEVKSMDTRRAADAKQPRLIVTGFAIFGGVTIQN